MIGVVARLDVKPDMAAEFEAAAAALLLACDILCAPILLTDSAPPNTSSGAMSSGMGRLAAEISGAKKKGAHAWNTASEGSKALARLQD